MADISLDQFIQQAIARYKNTTGVSQEVLDLVEQEYKPDGILYDMKCEERGQS